MPTTHWIPALPFAACLLAAPSALADTLFRGTLAERAVVEDELPSPPLPGESPVRVGYRFGAAGGSTTRVRLEPVTDGAFAPALEIRDTSGNVVLEDASGASAELALFLDDDVEGLYTLTLGDSTGSGSGAYRLEFEHEDHGNPAPLPDRSIELAPDVWHMLTPPVETDASYRDVFVTGGGLAADGFVGGSGAGAFAIYLWDPDAVDANGAAAGGYRRPTLDEPIGPGTGFWFLHTAPDAVTVTVPAGSAAPWGRVYGDGGEDGVRAARTLVGTIAALPR